MCIEPKRILMGKLSFFQLQEFQAFLASKDLSNVLLYLELV